MTHPYKMLPDLSFWSRAVAGGCYEPNSILMDAGAIIRADDKIASAGSCFAANAIPYLESAGFTYVRTEAVPQIFAVLQSKRFGYETFSAAYGHIYTTRQMVQLVQRALHLFRPKEDRWYAPDAVIDPFRPGLQFPASSDYEFDLLTEQHLEATLEALRTASVFLFTPGLTECWASVDDGAVYPACPGTISGTFDPLRHRFVNLSTSDVKEDLLNLVALLAKLNRRLRIILTVSPVPLVATANHGHVVTASIYSKSVLVGCAVETASQFEHVRYFPSFDIITGPQAPDSYFEADRRNVSKEGIDTVMRVLLANCEFPHSIDKPLFDRAAALSSRIAAVECEEQAVDRT